MSTVTANRDEDRSRAWPDLVSHDPATGAEIASFPVVDSAGVHDAVRAARDAATAWSAIGLQARAEALMAWRRTIAADAEAFIDLVHSENGKPLDDARVELLATLELISWNAANCARVLGDRSVDGPPAMVHLRGAVTQRPFGVVGVIGPWNFPSATPVGILAPALAAGNAVVFKPSEVTPAVGQWLADAWGRAVPDHPVLVVVHGRAETGRALVDVPVDKVAFTGSVASGRAVARACAEHITPVLLELGGNDPAIVAGDADLDDAARAIVWGAFQNTGQGCISIERALVVDEIYDAFAEKVAVHARAVRPGRDSAPQVGPVALAAQFDVVVAHVEDALDRGAALLAGRADAAEAPYVDPVVLGDVPRDALAAREETFGPTLALVRVSDLEEAIAIANEGPYGLGSAVFSRDDGDAIARRLNAGMTAVNNVLGFSMLPGLPFGGSGASGFGRKHGDEGLREFARPHAIATRVAEPRLDPNAFAPAGVLAAVVERVTTDIAAA